MLSEMQHFPGFDLSRNPVNVLLQRVRIFTLVARQDSSFFSNSSLPNFLSSAFYTHTYTHMNTGREGAGRER